MLEAIVGRAGGDVGSFHEHLGRVFFGGVPADVATGLAGTGVSSRPEKVAE